MPDERVTRVTINSPMQGTVVRLSASAGDVLQRGRPILVLESMKMEHDVVTPVAGVVHKVAVTEGDTVNEGQRLAVMEAVESAAVADDDVAAIDLDAIRPDLQEVLERQEKKLDAARPEAVERRRKTGQRTVRENIDDLCDDGSFVEYAGLVIAAQRRRRPVEELIDRTPADGLVCGLGRVNGHLFEDAVARVIAMSYDYTVLAGTQGMQNHRKKDRMFELAEAHRLPVVIFTEGGGGRPGDTDGSGVAGLDVMAFHLFARLSRVGAAGGDQLGTLLRGQCSAARLL